MLSAGCNSPANQTTQPPGIETDTGTTAPAPAPTISSTPIVSLEEVRPRLSETGNVFVPDVNMASELTGYSVATPSFIPDGFLPVEIPGAGGAYNVFTLGDPADIGGVAYPYSVTIQYSQAGEFSTGGPFFQITQSRNRIGSAPEGGHAQIGEHEGKKTLLSDLDPPRLSLAWNDGTMYYVMEGLLTEPLDEETLIKIAASMAY